MSAELDVNANALFAGEAAAARAWLMTVNLKTIAADYPNFNWQGFAYQAECAAHDRVKQGNIPEGEAWSEIAFVVYEHLAAHERLIAPLNPLSGLSFETSPMTLRLWMISRLGAVAGHPIRDPASVTRWFLEHTGTSLEEARRMAGELRSIPAELWSQHMDVLRALTAIKSRLNIVRRLGLTEPPPEITRWFELWDDLP